MPRSGHSSVVNDSCFVLQLGGKNKFTLQNANVIYTLSKCISVTTPEKNEMNIQYAFQAWFIIALSI